MKHLYYEHHCKKYDWTLFVKVGFVHFSYLGGGGDVELSCELRPIIIHVSDTLHGLNSKKGSADGE